MGHKTIRYIIEDQTHCTYHAAATYTNSLSNNTIWPDVTVSSNVYRRFGNIVDAPANAAINAVVRIYLGSCRDITIVSDGQSSTCIQQCIRTYPNIATNGRISKNYDTVIN